MMKELKIHMVIFIFKEKKSQRFQTVMDNYYLLGELNNLGPGGLKEGIISYQLYLVIQ